MDSREPMERAHVRLCVIQIDGLPQATTEHDSLWMPSEPLIDPVSLKGPPTATVSAAHVFAASAGDSARNILRKIHEIASDLMRGRLSEVLTFVTDHEADVILLPEYLVPVSCLDLLVGFSRGRAVVAGLGVVRNDDEAEILLARAVRPTDAADLVGRNVAVLVVDERVHMFTKRSPAEHESATPGTGPAVVSLNLGDRPVKVGVAVCMDYLQHQSDLFDGDPDIVCIPAFSANIDAFRPDAPRDYVRMFANCAAHGGSTIFAPSIRGPAFADAGGVRPLASASEGVIMIEWDRAESKPTSLRRTENRLVLRSAVIERDTAHAVSLEAVRQLTDLQDRSAHTSVPDLGERLSRWLTHIDDLAPLREALEEYRRSVAQELVDPALYALLSTHVTVADGGRNVAVRAAQARFVTQRISELVGSGIAVPSAGLALDAYAEIAATAPRSSDTLHTQTGKRWHFAITLGSYESATAAATLPRQFNFLRAIAGLAPHAISVTYRLHSETSADGPDLHTRFDVIVDGDEDVLSADDVEGQLRSMLVQSWALSASDEPIDPPGQNLVGIHIDASTSRPAIHEDWASIADLLRTHTVPIAVDMRIEPIDHDSEGGTIATLDEEAWLRRMSGIMSAIPTLHVGDDADRRATAYFSALGDAPQTESRALGLSITLSSAEQIPPLLASTIQYELLGQASSESRPISTDDKRLAPAPFSPSELIGIFHPPYGRIQGRGVPHRLDRELPYRGRSLPAGGTQIGSARIAGPRRDRRVDVTLDESARSRHLYVIGRTGTGKTNLLKELCRQDILAGRGLAVVDPHGDLVDYLTMHCGDRLAETVLLDFGDRSMVPAFNPLTVDIGDARGQALHTTDFLRALESRYYNEFTGPVFDDMLRQALETIFEPGFPMAPSIDLVEGMYRNRVIRQMVAQTLPENSVLRDRWNVFEAIPEKEKAERITWMLSKFADLMPAGSPLRLALCTTEDSPLSIEQAVWRQGILLIKLPESSLGSDAASFLGATLVRRIQRAIFDYQRGTGEAPGERPTFTLCIDEFQRFATAGLETLVAEARKFGCGLVLAHQNLDQLYAFSRFEGGRSREVLEAILGNAGSMIAFRVGPNDVATLAQLLHTDQSTFSQLPTYKALCRLTVAADDTPCFTLSVPDADRHRGTPAAAELVRARMAGDRYWVKMDQAEAEINGHLDTFEAALHQTRSGVDEANRRHLASVQARIEREPDQLDDIVENDLGIDPAVQVNFILDVVGAVLSNFAPMPSSLRDEVAATVFGAMVSLLEKPPSEDWRGDYQATADEISARDFGGADDEQVAALLDAVRRMSELCALTQPESRPVAQRDAMFGALLAGAARRELASELRRSLVAGLFSGSDPEQLLEDLQDAEDVRLPVEVVYHALRDAARRASFATIWDQEASQKTPGGSSGYADGPGKVPSQPGRVTTTPLKRWRPQ
jgi:predicted amidohydrolase